MKNNKYLSTPFWIFVGTVIVSIIFLVISYYILKSCGWWSDLFLNLGYGIIASTIVAFLIDLGATKRKQKADKTNLSLILTDLKNECAELPSEMYIAVYESFCYDSNEKYTFSEWTNKLFMRKNNSISEKQEIEIKYLLQTVEEIQKKAREALELMRYSIENTCVTDELIKRTKKLNSICRLINIEKKRTDYDKCKKLILVDLKPLITEIFPDLEIDFIRSYNEEDYT